MLIFFSIVLAFSFNSCNCLTLPKIFNGGIVLQAEPTGAMIWGFLDGDTTNEVQLKSSCNTKDIKTMSFLPKEDDYLFEFPINLPQNEVCDFQILQGDTSLSLKDVHFGDVWICSGQSNMEFSMGGHANWDQGGVFYSEEEIAKTAEYPNIRMFKLQLQANAEPQDDLNNLDFEYWAKTDDVNAIKRFSAVCLLTARYMADVLGKEKTIGLIETSWGGTRVEPWSTIEGLTNCNVTPNIDNDYPQNSNTYIYNAMIHPLIRLSIYGALWYQGEANAFWNRDAYDCTFSQLISEWRRVWSINTGTNPNFPFGFVQLSTWQANDLSPDFPMIRWYQTYKYGYTPNDVLQNVFMAVSLDTYDEEYGIHPRNKQLPSKRLATAGLNVAYGLKEYPTHGPFPVLIDHNALSDRIQIDITYDQPFIWNSTETEGFYICVDRSRRCNYSGLNGLWKKIPKNSVSVSSSGNSLAFQVVSEATALAYLWETTPVLGTEALPIYADNEFRLPGGPWVLEL